jgi:ubiquinone/menaquinone biosynthesis C-methylase UbiE
MTKELVQSQFGRHATAYTASGVHAKGWSLERLVELASPHAGWHALDIATGAGHTAAAFAPLVAHVIASDIPDEMLSEARGLAAARGLANMTTARADAEALPFAAASFDLVTCRLAAHHFPHPGAFVAEATRVLKPGGTLGLVDNIGPDSTALPAFSRAEIGDTDTVYNAFEKLRDPSHGRALTLAEWTEHMQRSGLAFVAAERARKEMDFADYVTRMGCTIPTIARLKAMLFDGAPALKAFLDPRDAGGRIAFFLHEAIVIARKPE